MFNGFKKKFVKVNKGKIFCRFKGNGPPYCYFMAIHKHM